MSTEDVVLNLTDSQKWTIQCVQRAASCLSIIGASFILVTFLGSTRFRKPINRLAFYAAIANILSTIATTIARAGPNAGQTSSLCQMQGLFIQTFLVTDALFIAFMALNVYLTVKLKYSSAQLRKLEPYYVGISFGCPLLSGIIMLFAKNPNYNHGLPIYGDATLWCWIAGREYEFLRLATFYGPVWVIILITMMLYAAAGKVVFEMRSSLRFFEKRNHPRPAGPGPSSSQTDLSSSGAPAAKGGSSQAIQLTTVTQIDVDSNDGISEPKPPMGCTFLADDNQNYKYTVTVESTAPKSHYDDRRNTDIDYDESTADMDNETFYDDEERDLESYIGSDLSSPGGSSSIRKTSTNTHIAPPATPAVMNRAAIAQNRKTMKANAAAWAYTRCSFLFFIGLLITWLPSSLNRVYGIVHPQHQVFGLYLAAGLVLPLQGFWNFIIYLTTSWSSCKMMWRDIYGHFNSPRKLSINSIQIDPKPKISFRRPGSS